MPISAPYDTKRLTTHFGNARRYVNNDPNHPIHAPEQDEQIKQGIHTREESMIGRISPLKET